MSRMHFYLVVLPCLCWPASHLSAADTDTAASQVAYTYVGQFSNREIWLRLLGSNQAPAAS